MRSRNAEQGATIAGTATMLAGWGDVPGVTINRFCASGIDAVAQAASRIRGGDLELAAASGVKSVSRVPLFSDGGPLFCDPATVNKVGSAGLRPADVDVFEFAEAFAAVCLRFRRDLDAGPERMNPNGGTIAMGHAFGATGAVLLECVAS